MPEIDILVVLAAAAAAFLIGGAYYAILGSQLATARAGAVEVSMAPWVLAVEVGRCLVLALVVAGIASRGEITGVPGGLLLGLVLWVGFPLVLWIGAIAHEKTPTKLAAIHAGDWLCKLLAVGAIASAIG